MKTTIFLAMSALTVVNAGVASVEIDGALMDAVESKYGPDEGFGSNIEQIQQNQATKDEISIALKTCQNALAANDFDPDEFKITDVVVPENEDGAVFESPNLPGGGGTVSIGDLMNGNDEGDEMMPVMNSVYTAWKQQKEATTQSVRSKTRDNNAVRRGLAFGDNAKDFVQTQAETKTSNLPTECEVAFTQVEDYTGDTVSSLAQVGNTLSGMQGSAPTIRNSNPGAPATVDPMVAEEVEDEVFEEVVNLEGKEGEIEEENTITCYHFEKDGKGLSLCVESPELVVVDGNEMEYVKLAGEIENTGINDLCNVTLSVPDIDDALEASATVIPDNFEPSEKFSYKYVIPINPESDAIPQVDIWSSFYTCLPERVEEVEEEKVVVVVEEEEEVIEVQEEDDLELEQKDPVIAEEPVENRTPTHLDQFFSDLCFESCPKQIVKGEGLYMSTCIALNEIFYNDCHSCSTLAIEAAQLQCLSYGCTDMECGLEEQKTSGAKIAALSTLASVISGVLFVYIS